MAEIHYWRDVSSILDAMQLELNHPSVSQLTAKMTGWSCGDCIKEFENYKQQVLSGALEAKTNYDFLKEIELPFVTLTTPAGLTNTPLLFPSMMSTLQGLFKKSAFYKESRIISLLEKIINAILEVVEGQIKVKELFGSLVETKGKAKKIAIKISQTHMIIDIISKSLFIRDWLTAGTTTAESKAASSASEIAYLKFSRPDTAYIHELAVPRPSSSGKYVEITNKKLPPHLKIQERMAATSEKNMWFERAEMILKTVEYVKKAATNIEAMCGIFSKICEFSAGIDPKMKLFGETVEFLDMYKAYELPYEAFEIHSAEAFESFVV